MLQRYKTTFNYIRAKCYISPHTLLFCLVFVLGRYHAVHILEIFGEVAGIIETHLVSHLSHRELTLAEQLLSMSQTDLSDKLRGRQAGQCHQLFNQTRFSAAEPRFWPRTWSSGAVRV